MSIIGLLFYYENFPVDEICRDSPEKSMTRGQELIRFFAILSTSFFFVFVLRFKNFLATALIKLSDLLMLSHDIFSLNTLLNYKNYYVYINSTLNCS